MSAEQSEYGISRPSDSVRDEEAAVADAQQRATSMPERAENCGHERSVTDTSDGLRSGQAQVDPLRETTF
jgi:hypothetical protein